MTDTWVMHEREVYDLLALVGDLGGVLEVMIRIVFIFIGPISEFSFLLNALQQLFLARTTDTSLFVKGKMKKNQKELKVMRT